MANEIYIAEGTVLSINGEAGADYAWSMEGVADGAGRVSARIDLGVAPRPFMYRWRCKVQFQATPTQYAELELYKSESNGTHEDGDVGTVDAALSDIDVLRNLQPIGAVVADEVDTTDMTSGGVIECYERYLSLVGWNASGATINATDSNFVFELTPIYQQPQA